MFRSSLLKRADVRLLDLCCTGAFRRVRESQVVPSWMGVAWVDQWRGQAICMPIPFNILGGWIRRGWLVLRFGMARSPSWVKLYDAREAYNLGYRDGRRDCKLETS